MDEASQSICEVEVYWNCDSPTANDWKQYQAPGSLERSYTKWGTQTQRSQQFRNFRRETKEHAKPGSSNNANICDTKRYDKARNLIDQFRKFSNDTDHEFNNSMEMVFEMSGRHEDLPSSVSTNAVAFTNKNDHNIDEPTDWDEDLFLNTSGVNQHENVLNNMKSPVQPLKPSKSTSTPKGDAKHEKCKKRSTKTPLKTKDPLPQPINGDIKTADDCLKFFMSTNSPKSQKLKSMSRKRPPKRQSQVSSTNTKQTQPKSSPVLNPKKTTPKRNSISPKPLQSCISNKTVTTSKLSCNIETKRKVTPKRKASDNFDNSISEDILNNLVMEDSWSDDILSNPSDKVKTTPRLYNYESILSPIKLVDSDKKTKIKTNHKALLFNKDANIKTKPSFTFKKTKETIHDKNKLNPKQSSLEQQQNKQKSNASFKSDIKTRTILNPTNNSKEDLFLMEEDDSMLLEAVILTESQKEKQEIEEKKSPVTLSQRKYSQAEIELKKQAALKKRPKLDSYVKNKSNFATKNTVTNTKTLSNQEHKPFTRSQKATSSSKNGNIKSANIPTNNNNTKSNFIENTLTKTKNPILERCKKEDSCIFSSDDDDLLMGIEEFTQSQSKKQNQETTNKFKPTSLTTGNVRNNTTNNNTIVKETTSMKTLSSKCTLAEIERKKQEALKRRLQKHQKR